MTLGISEGQEGKCEFQTGVVMNSCVKARMPGENNLLAFIEYFSFSKHFHPTVCRLQMLNDLSRSQSVQIRTRTRVSWFPAQSSSHRLTLSPHHMAKTPIIVMHMYIQVLFVKLLFTLQNPAQLSPFWEAFHCAISRAHGPSSIEMGWSHRCLLAGLPFPPLDWCYTHPPWSTALGTHWIVSNRACTLTHYWKCTADGQATGWPLSPICI